MTERAATGLIFRAASFAPESANDEARTVELIWTTGAVALRGGLLDVSEPVEERLMVDDGACDLERLNSGAPVLLDHRAATSMQIGVVERAWIEGGVGKAVIRISKRADVDPIWTDIKDGILRGVSVGYTIQGVEIERRDDNVPLITVTKWTPHEISFVPVRADLGAVVRAAEQLSASEEPTTQETTSDEPSAEPATLQNPEETMPQTSDLDAVRSEAVTQERQRAAEINTAVRSVGLSTDFAADLIARGVDLDAARSAILSEVAKKQTPEIQGVRSEHNDTTLDNPANRSAAMADAIAARFSSRVQMTDAAREFSGHSLTDMASDLLQARGLHPMTRAKIAIVERALHSTSDFPQLLSNAANKMLLGEYGAATPTYRQIAAKKTFNDFKAHSFLRGGDFPMLLETGESGEVKVGTMGENGETVKLATYGRRIGLTRQAIVNDDLGAFADFTMKAGRRVLDFENATAYSVLLANGVLSDGKALFHADHKNLASAASAIDVANVGKGRAAMRKQTSMDGLKLNLAPRLLVVGADKELEAEQLVAAIQPQSSGNVNPFSGRLQIVADANVSGNQWFLFCDPAIAEVLVYGYLAGAEGPQIATRAGWEVDGVEIKVTLDFAAGAVDFRGAYKNAGN